MSRAPSASRSYDKNKYQTIFPQYIDAALQPRDGRRLTKAQSVVCPSLEEIIVAVRQLGFADSFVEPMKSLPCAQSQARQVPAPRGCIKVAIKQPADAHYIKKSEFDVETRAAIVEAIPTKSELLRRVSEAIKAKGGVRPTPVNMAPLHQPKDTTASSSGTSGRIAAAPSAAKKR